MRRIKKLAITITLSTWLSLPAARADFWGGDVVVLAQILEQSIMQLQQLKQILGTNEDSFRYLQDINEGIKDALKVQETLNRTIRPGQFSDLSSLADVTKQVESLYGKIPNSSQAKLQMAHDLTVAESVHLHNEAFKYAEEVDPEAERIKAYAQVASPQGAAKTSLEGQGVMIHVLNQILRTNAALLKVQSENLALENRKEKIQTEQFKSQYNEISKAMQNLKPNYDLPSMSGSD